MTFYPRLFLRSAMPEDKPDSLLIVSSSVLYSLWTIVGVIRVRLDGSMFHLSIFHVTTERGIYGIDTNNAGAAFHPGFATSDYKAGMVEIETDVARAAD